MIEGCTGCCFSETREVIVIGAGNEHAQVTSFPKALEHYKDIEGRPFVAGRVIP